MVAKNRLKEYGSELQSSLDRLQGKKVLIVGDVGLDEYTLGQVRRISPEAPVPIVEVEKEELRLGLSANVAQNIASLGGVPVLVAVVGDDSAAGSLRKLLREAGVSDAHLIVDGGRPTTRKTRVMVQNHHIVRVDYELRQFLQENVRSRLLQNVKENLKECAAVVIQDYAKGVVSESLVKDVVGLAREFNKIVCVDPHRSTPIHTYRGVDIMTPNLEESFALANINHDDLRPDNDIVRKVGYKLMESIGSKQMVITLGKDGMRIFGKDQVVDLPTNARQVFDVTGAGDTVIAAMALAWGSGLSLELACALANAAAGIVVGKIGCVPCPIDELRNTLAELSD